MALPPGFRRILCAIRAGLDLCLVLAIEGICISINVYLIENMVGAVRFESKTAIVATFGQMGV